MADKILIFVPGYNISRTIERATINLIELRKEFIFDAIYVDNASSDDSLAIMEKLVAERDIRFISIISNKENLGYGGSQKVAFRYGFSQDYDYLIEYDGDLQYPHTEIVNLYRKIKSGQYSVVFGSRITTAKDLEQMPKWKAFGNKMTSELIKWALDLKISEIHTGFRIYDLRKMRGADLDKCHNDYRWTLDSVVAILRVNGNFGEIPVKALYHKEASSPPFFELLKAVSYMCCRALKYKLDNLQSSKSR